MCTCELKHMCACVLYACICVVPRSKAMQGAFWCEKNQQIIQNIMILSFNPLALLLLHVVCMLF